ncbi:acetyltransferase [Nitratireductor pacificus pht-3B]|uniref:Acetyltransferase n=1 Tax=Nitratireductor pacificus pht-3B TaxID=391937 RepID=K2MAX5_9HYPH|nr:acetyltransferase [Nitratireductor pacificus pht-3B]
MTDPVFHFDYAASPDGRAEVARLILDTFAVDVTPLDRLSHDPSVVSFGWWHGAELIANVSLYRRALWLQGRKVEAFGVQSVAVRPAWRGRGLFRDLMARALAHADARAELVVLTTGTPELYIPFGFRQVRETSFAGPLTPAGARGASPPVARCGAGRGADARSLRPPGACLAGLWRLRSSGPVLPQGRRGPVDRPDASARSRRACGGPVRAGARADPARRRRARNSLRGRDRRGAWRRVRHLARVHHARPAGLASGGGDPRGHRMYGARTIPAGGARLHVDAHEGLMPQSFRRG